jgi:hypothetical protein
VAEFDGGEQRAGHQHLAYVLLPGMLFGVPLRGGGHVIDDEHATRGQRRDSAVEPFPFTALGISEDEVEPACLAKHRQCVGAPQFHETRPVTLRGQRRGARVLLHRDDRDVGPRQQRGGYPGGAYPRCRCQAQAPGLRQAGGRRARRAWPTTAPAMQAVCSPRDVEWSTYEAL